MIKSTLLVLAVPDLERSSAFYKEVLGFEISEMGDPGWRLLTLIVIGNTPTAIFFANSNVREQTIREITNGPISHVAILAFFMTVLAFNAYGLVRLAMRIFSSKQHAL